MTLDIQPVNPYFGAEIHGMDVRGHLDSSELDQLQEAFYRYSVLVFRDQDVTIEEQETFTRYFGTPTVHVLDQYLHSANSAILVISNVLDEGGNTEGLDEGDVVEWHSDLFWHATPSVGSLLYAVAVPPQGGDTLFACMYTAYERLSPQDRRLLRGKTAVRSLNHLTERERERNPLKPPLTEEQKRRAPPVAHPVFRKHPVTHKPSLFLSEMAIHCIDGMTEADSDALVERLIADATQDKFVYRHKWRKGDLVVWDNRCTIHTRTASDPRYPRILHRTTLQGEAVIAAE